MNCGPMQLIEEATFQSYANDNKPIPSHFQQFRIAEEVLKKYELDQKSGWVRLSTLFSHCGSNVTIRDGFVCDLGKNISIGDNVSIGRNVVILDMGPVEIGDNVDIEDNVHIYNASHRVRTHTRWRSFLYSRVSIGNDVRIEKNSVLLPGALIQNGAVIGKGTVVRGIVGPRDVITSNELDSELRDALLEEDLSSYMLANRNIPRIPYLNNSKNIIRKPFFFRHGHNILGGERGYGLINPHAVFDDSHRIILGESCLLGPGVALLTDLGRMNSGIKRIIRKITRTQSLEHQWGSISLGDNVWLAGRVTILPGVKIGNNSAVLASNCLISQDIPEDSVITFGDDGIQIMNKIAFNREV